tara:strand:- start:3948 stop:4940 length:993 start_codon:yes stop_codon:yes gene_type:complete
MSKKIVIIPTFCESHLIKCQIPNIIDTIDPNYIIYNEGMFPNGTEGNKALTKEWLDKYTLNGDGKRGFDYEELKDIISQHQITYPKVKIILNEMEYFSGMTSTECFRKASTNFEELGINVEEGDYIFPYEGDVFHHEDSKEEILDYLSQLNPGDGFRSIWIDYVQNFWYVEKSRLKPWINMALPVEHEDFHSEKNYMSRRICFRYDKGGIKYNKMIDNFMTKDYHNPITGYGMLYPTDLITYHYAWIRPHKFRELRCDQLGRHPGYWEEFSKGLDQCDKYELSEVCIRPSHAKWTSGYVKFFNTLPHPKHIKNHELWTDLEEDIKNKLLN